MPLHTQIHIALQLELEFVMEETKGNQSTTQMELSQGILQQSESFHNCKPDQPKIIETTTSKNYNEFTID